MRLNSIKRETISKSQDICSKLQIPLPPRASTLGKYGELLAYEYFESLGLSVNPLSLIDNRARVDFVVNDKRIEVKTAIEQSNGKYSLIFYKNKINNIPNYDYVLCILLKDINTPPKMVILNSDKIGSRTGITANLERIDSFKEDNNIWN